MTDSTQVPESIQGLAEAAIDLGALLSQIVAHMALWGVEHADSPPRPESVREVLSGLLGGVLAPLAERHPDASLESAGGILREIAALIESEVMFVAPDIDPV